MKISKKDQETLLEKLKARPAAPSQPSRGEVDYTRQLDKNGDKVEATIRADKGTVNEGTALQFLKDEGLNPEDYEVVGFRKSQWSGFNGEDMESVRYNFRKIGSDLARIPLPDLDDLHNAVKKSRTKKGHPFTKRVGGTEVICLADCQLGKTDVLGGTEETLERLENSLEAITNRLKSSKPEEILLLDGGDSIEGFENTAAQYQTNDLRLTEMLRVWRRVLWSWIDTTASLAPSVKVASVPSNHARVRRGKGYLSEPFDDYGIEVLAQCFDIAKVNPDKYSHVEFYTPDDFQDTLALQTLDSTVVGLAHGDQVNNPNSLGTWLSGQALQNSPVGNADILVANHFHHLKVDIVGNNRTIFVTPTSDNGSSWYTNKSGNSSSPGVMVFSVDKESTLGWSGLEVL